MSKAISLLFSLRHETVGNKKGFERMLGETNRLNLLQAICQNLLCILGSHANQQINSSAKLLFMQIYTNLICNLAPNGAVIFSRTLIDVFMMISLKVHFVSMCESYIHQLKTKAHLFKNAINLAKIYKHAKMNYNKRRDYIKELSWR